MDLRWTSLLNNGVEIPGEALGVFQVPDDGAADGVRRAPEAGCRHIDTAAMAAISALSQNLPTGADPDTFDF